MTLIMIRTMLIIMLIIITSGTRGKSTANVT